MTPAEAVAAINLALGPAWRARFDSLTGELSARRGSYSVHGKSAGEVVERAANLVVERVQRVSEVPPAPRSLVVPVASPESTPVLIPSFVVVSTPGVVKDGGK